MRASQRGALGTDCLPMVAGTFAFPFGPFCLTMASAYLVLTFPPYTNQVCHTGVSMGNLMHIAWYPRSWKQSIQRWDTYIKYYLVFNLFAACTKEATWVTMTTALTNNGDLIHLSFAALLITLHLYWLDRPP